MTVSRRGVDRPDPPPLSVRFDGVRRAEATLPGSGEDYHPVFHRACVALAAESTGLAQRALEMSVEYAKDRQQFGRPIGAYQAVSHRCAQMLLETENSRSAVYGAAWAADAEPESLPLAASMAKAYASDAGWRVPDAAIQVHGGIGFTWEHDLHFFLKRGRANAAMFGDAKWHRERVADACSPARPRRPAPEPDAGDGRARSHLRRRDRHLGRRPRGGDAARRGGRRRVRLGAGAVPQRGHPGHLPGGEDRADRGRHRDRLGLHPQPLHPRDQRPRHRRDVRRPLPARDGRRGQTAERDLAQRRLRPAGAAPARGDRGDAADHAPGERRRADPLRGRVLRHRHQGLGPAPPGAARGGADLHRRRAGGDGADGRRRRRRPDRPPDPEPALDRRGRRPGLRGGLAALRPRALRLRLPADRLLRDRRRRGPGDRDGPPDDLLLRDGQDLHAALGAARLRRQRRRGGRGLPPRRPRRRPGGDQRRDGRGLLRRRPARQGPRPGRGHGRARRRPLPHPADLLHLPRGAERVPEPHHRRLRPEA